MTDYPAWGAAAALAAALGLAAGAGPAKACSPAETARNKALVQAFVDAARDGPVGLTERSEKFMTPRYIQHHPGVESGRQPFIDYHVQYYKDHPVTPGGPPEKLAAVVAECDMVMIMHHRPRPDPDHPGQTIDAYAFDLWRVKDGKVDEHWDSATEVFKPAK